jgi:signal transduction histidine kinase
LVGSLEFTYLRFWFVPYLAFAWVTLLVFAIPIFFRLRRKVIAEYERDLAYRKGQIAASIAEQVSHDIRSPLAALKSALNVSESFDESTKSQVRMALARISGIADGLLQGSTKASETFTPSDGDLNLKQQLTSEAFSVELVSLALQEITSEKSTVYSGLGEINVEWETPRWIPAFCRVQPIELGRILSNLINNGIEALEGPGTVSVALSERSEGVVIRIRDTGRGIPKSVLSELGVRGYSYGKRAGNGLGLSHAIETVKSWQGILEIRSELGRGTVVEIFLPKVAPPSWFPHNLGKFRFMLVADEDEAIHAAVEDEASRNGKLSPGLIHLYSANELISWFRSSYSFENDTLFLIGERFSTEKKSGLELVQAMGVTGQSIIMVSEQNVGDMIRQCSRAGTKVLPKMMISGLGVNKLTNG